MDPDIALLAARHALSAEVARDIEALFSLRLSPSVTLAPDGSPEPTEPRPPDAGRYERIGLLGVGGMGEVWRVRDRDLGRTLAMKAIRAELMHQPHLVARFVEEAQCSAQLQHPGIVPVHELGQLPDGRHYFTMREVRGRTFAEAIREVHQVSRYRWETGATGWTFRRLVDAFHRACEAVAYAHVRGVVHRDLKPENVMLGAHGEVLVVDWGLAKVLGHRDRAAEAGELDPVVTERSTDAAKATRMGAVAGTPAYMPPEQARGEIDRIDARSDVYSLGAILYELLSGRAPYTGGSGMEILEQVRARRPESVGQATRAEGTWSFGFDEAPPSPGPLLPAELVAACERAMDRSPSRRFAHAGELAADVAAWLEGARRREQALEVLARARGLGPEAEALSQWAAALRIEAAELLADVQPWEPEERKAPGWAKEDEAAALDARLKLLRVEAEQTEQAALRADPLLPEAHAALAARYRRVHAEREATRGDAARAEVLLRRHAESLPGDHPVRREAAAYLKGDGALTVVTDPPGAEVLLHRYVSRNRRLVPVFERSLGPTPLVAVSLPMGSYLAVLRHPDRAEVRYPVLIARGEHWDGAPPGARLPHPIPLPEALGPDEAYVPPGWFWAGGDPDAVDAMPRSRLWCDGLVLRRFPVTNHEYLAFLNDLVERGEDAEALRWVPRERVGVGSHDGAMNYQHGRDGTFGLATDPDGDTWLPEWPVVHVHFGCAVAYARWCAGRTGLPWRLPGELEWEKAARGVDGRGYPWGDAFDPSWSCCQGSHAGRPLPAAVDSFPVDESPYGVRGLGGNVRDWCGDVYARGGPASLGDRVAPPVEPAASPAERRAVRGGYWGGTSRNGRTAFRHGSGPASRIPFLGFRLARSWPEDPG